MENGNRPGPTGSAQDRHRGDDDTRQSDKPQREQPNRQIDDNQDDLGRDVNNPAKTSNDINKV